LKPGIIKGGEKMKKLIKSSKFWLCISLVLILVSMLATSFIQTNFGKVRVTKINIAAPEGQNVNALLFTPKQASKDNKLPLIITCHGSYNSKEMQAQNYVELSRRGFVVCTIDSYCHGLSSVENGDNGTVDNTERYTCMVHTLEYLMATLDYIDMEKIGLTGHSMGGFHCNDTVIHYLTREALGLGKNPISAVLNMGCETFHTYWGLFADAEKLDIDAIIAEDLHESGNVNIVSGDEPIPIDIDYGIVAGKYDEWFFADENGNPHHFLSQDRAKMFIEQVGVTPEGAIESGKYYQGEVNGKNHFRVIYQPEQIHPLNAFSYEGAHAASEFFYNSFGTPKGFEYIPPANQIWFIKELFNLLGLIGIFLFIVPFATQLIKIPYFNELHDDSVKPNNPGPRNTKGKIVYAVCYFINGLIPALLVMPVMFWWIGQGTAETWVSDIPHVWNRFFGQPNTNELSIWTALTALAIAAVLFISYKAYGKKAGQTVESLGLVIPKKQIFKTVLLALSIVSGIYVITFFADWLLTTDFRFWMLAVKVFNAQALVYALIYMLPFILFYIVNSAVVNGFNRIDSMKDWQSVAITCIGNVTGILIMIVIQYGTLISKGTLIWNPMRIFNLVPLVILIPVATIISRKLFRLTGNVYLGGVCMGIFYTIMIVANTMFRGSLFLG
jgi:hypothetical protein